MEDLDHILTIDGDNPHVKADFKIHQAVTSYRLAQLGQDAVVQIFENQGLLPFLRHVYSHSTSNGAPYHNIYHIHCVILNCYEGAYHTGLPSEQIRSLLLAALFHDFDHTKGECQDTTNIYLAIKGLHEALQSVGMLSLLLTQVEIDAVISTIEITKYPYEKTPSSLLQKIIRDADLMQPYEESPEVLLSLYRGLQTEMTVLSGKPYTYEEFGDGVAKFMDKVTWNTSWGSNKAKKLDWEAQKTRLQNLITGQR